MATVLEGFLVRLGFEIDQDQLAKFNDAVSAAGERFMQIGKAAIGAGVAVGAAFAKSTAEINDLYKLSNNTGASIEGILSLQGAVERVGGSAENVSAAFEEFSMNAKTYGRGFENLVRNQLGVSLRNANGEARDMSDVFVDMSKKLADLAKVDPGLARMKAEAVGLGAIFDDIVKGDFPAELERSSKFAGLFGDKIDAGANASHRLMNEMGQVWDTVTQGAMAATASVTDALQLDKKLASFNDGFADFLSATIDSQVQIIKEASGFFDWIGKVLFKSDDYYDDSRRKMLEERVQSGTATEEEKAELDELKEEKRTKDTAKEAYVSEDYAERTGLADKWNDTEKLKAEFFGVDPNDSKAMAELKGREVTDDDLLEAQEDSDRLMLGVELQKRQRQAQADVKQKFDEAAGKDLPYGLNDEKDPYTKAMEEAKGYAIANEYMKGSPSQKEAAAVAAAQSVTNSQDNRNQSKTQNVNVQQTINISGAGDPAAVGQAVAKETVQATRNQGNQGIF